jgi:hypothetical protein
MSQQASKVSDLNEDKPLEVKIAAAKKEDEQVNTSQGSFAFDGPPPF